MGKTENEREKIIQLEPVAAQEVGERKTPAFSMVIFCLIMDLFHNFHSYIEVIFTTLIIFF